MRLTSASGRRTLPVTKTVTWPAAIWIHGHGSLAWRAVYGPLIRAVRATAQDVIITTVHLLLFRHPCCCTNAPPYLSTYCEPTSSHSGRCHLCSAESGQLTVPRTRTNYGDRSFAIYGPVVWNNLPADLCLLNFTASVQETTENVPVLG